MNIKKRGLGKGLSDLGLGALLGDLKTPVAPVDQFQTVPENNVIVDGQLKKLPINALKPGKYQPRKNIEPEALSELADSIRTQGVIQPVVVRPIENNQFEIIAGERRWRAAQLAELNYIPAIVREINDETAMVFALIENIQRRDLNVMEEATALNRMITEFNMTHETVAKAVGKSRVAVTNILRLLKLNYDVRAMVESGKLEMGHARALLMLDEEKQSYVANIIVSRQLSVRETEDFIRKTMQQKTEDHLESSSTVLNTLQDRLSEKLNTKVSVTQNAKGRGKMVIHFRNQKELENLLSQIE
jgi:ParB family chromosome partitioning protein